jgi:predicted lipoprotein with Yx(FWY)xxD motif
VKVANDATLGPLLTDAKGMTLYRYTKDQANVSNCYDQCAQNWPPLLSTSGQPILPAGLTGQLGTTTRTDGAKQVTYNGMPLYYWAKDTKPGDTTGQNVGSVWFVVQPTASASLPPASGNPTEAPAKKAPGGSYGNYGGY